MSTIKMAHWDGGYCYFDVDTIVLLQPSAAEGCSNALLKDGGEVDLKGTPLEVRAYIKEYHKRALTSRRAWKIAFPSSWNALEKTPAASEGEKEEARKLDKELQEDYYE